jgi:hypothetical protein
MGYEQLNGVQHSIVHRRRGNGVSLSMVFRKPQLTTVSSKVDSTSRWA